MTPVPIRPCAKPTGLSGDAIDLSLDCSRGLGGLINLGQSLKAFPAPPCAAGGQGLASYRTSDL